MNNHQEEFNQKREAKNLSESAYFNLLYNSRPNPNIKYDTPKISIIIPTHNRFEQLSELINSIYSQTYKNFEIILIDDISSDETAEFYSNYHDKRLKYWRNYENLGMGLNRQKGYNLSSGDYIIFCDDDDYYIDNTYFFDLITIFKDETINVICSESYTHYEKEDRYVYSGLKLDNGKIDSIEYFKNFMTKYPKPKSLFPAAFRRKTLIEAEFKEMTMMNDTSIYLRALMMGGKTYINKKIIGVYRVHSKNDTLDPKSSFIIKNLEEKRKIYEYLKENKIITNQFEWYAQQIAITVNYYLDHSDDEPGKDDVLNWVWKNVSYDEYLKYKKRVIESNNLKLYYFNNWPNFGDLINENILSSIFKIDFEFASFQNADLCGCGSIFDKLVTNSNIGEDDKELQDKCKVNKPMHIWGTGLMFDYDNVEQTGVRPFIIHALRGENTRKRLSNILGKDISCVLADPGILASLIVEPSEKKYSVGIVPHRWDKDEVIFERMLEHYPNSKIIDVQNEPEQVLKEISSCEHIISTSLHGLIVADSYNIPNCWCEISDRVIGKGFKFHDYFSSFGTDRDVFDLRSGNLPDIEKDFKCNFKSIDQVYEKQKELIECFPFKL